MRRPMQSVRHVIPIALCALAALALQSAAVPGLPAAPASGATSGPLAEAVQLYRDAVARDELRGVVLHVAQRGRTVLREAIGHRHQAYQLPMEKDTLFRMASNTKPVVASAVLMLAEEGRLRLEDPVAKHLASWNTDKSRNVTIAQLLTHSSGLRIRPIFYPFEEGHERTLQAAVAKFGAEGPAEPPGEYSYNNAGYNTLGALIEVVSGQPLEAFLKSRIYDPLGMTDTLNHEDETKLHRMATVYRGRRQGRGGPVAFTQGFTPGDEPDFPVIRASGGLISTTADYARFLEMWRKGGEYAGRRLLKPETVASAVQPRVRVSDEASYGYGWMIRADGSYYHAGSDGTMAWIDPSREIVGMVFTQSPGGINPSTRFRELVNVALRNHSPTRASSR